MHSEITVAFNNADVSHSYGSHNICSKKPIEALAKSNYNARNSI